VTFDCKEARPLIPSYADGELSEAQAGLLRKHLLECSSCRLLAQDEKALKSWFAGSAATAVPAGFAERVVRRAFAGDTGEHSGAAAGTAPAEIHRLRDFVATMAGLAAAAAILFTVAIRQTDLPDERGLRADEVRSFEEIRQELQELALERQQAEEREALEPTVGEDAEEDQR